MPSGRKRRGLSLCHGRDGGEDDVAIPLSGRNAEYVLAG